MKSSFTGRILMWNLKSGQLFCNTVSLSGKAAPARLQKRHWKVSCRLVALSRTATPPKPPSLRQTAGSRAARGHETHKPSLTRIGQSPELWMKGTGRCSCRFCQWEACRRTAHAGCRRPEAPPPAAGRLASCRQKARQGKPHGAASVRTSGGYVGRSVACFTGKTLPCYLSGSGFPLSRVP